jgi:hypothetical protein
MEDDFEEFWSNYPTDRNMPKKLARKRWLLMTVDKRRKAILALGEFKNYCAKNPWYRPVHAHRFLAQERYEGFQVAPVDQEKIAKAKDWADRYFKRGKYAETYR